MSDDKRAQLNSLTERRDKLRDLVSTVKGRLTAAREDVSQIEDECKKRKVAPDKLEGAIQQLEDRFNKEVSSLTDRVEKAEKSVEPFLEEA